MQGHRLWLDSSGISEHETMVHRNGETTDAYVLLLLLLLLLRCCCKGGGRGGGKGTWVEGDRCVRMLCQPIERVHLCT